MNTEELFIEYADKELEKNALKWARQLVIVLIVYSLFVGILKLNILPDNIIFSTIAASSKFYYCYIFVFCGFFLLTSKNPILKKLSYIPIVIVFSFIALVYLSYFHVVDLSSWIYFECETQAFGLFNITTMGLFLGCMLIKKYENIMQILALISIIMGFGGLIFYLGSNEIYSKALHYFVYHILAALVFVIIPTKNGVFKSLSINTDISKLSLEVTRYSLIIICIIFCIIEILRPILSKLVEHVSIVTTVCSLVFILMLMIYYSRKWVKKDLDSQILKQEAVDLQNTIEKVQSMSKIAILNGSPGKFHWTSEIFEILEIEPIDDAIGHNLLLKYLTKDSLDEVHEKWESAKDSKPGDVINFETTLTIITGKRNKKYLKCFSSNYIETDFDSRSVNVFVEDITDEVMNKKNLEESLASQKILIKEVHHRVKNNLQLIRSFINLEKRFHPGDYETILNVTEERINALSSIHTRIYNQDDMNYILMNPFLNELDDALMEFSPYNDINFNTDAPDYLAFAVNTVTPLTLIINELTTNSFKYAFDDTMENKTIYKSLKLFEKNGEDFVRFEYRDNGKGLVDFDDFLTSKSLGRQIISALSGQMDGEYEIISENGFGFVLIFPIK